MDLDTLRPAFHFTPPANWMNDPNGLVYFDGEYHLFYQYHPYSDVWGPMHWGHAVSKNLLDWEYLPIALSPDEHGMIFSGSAVVDENNTAGFGKNALVAIFTYHSNRNESQNLAYSLDCGRTWEKYENNPIISMPNSMQDFRDPKVFWHKTHWVMCLAAGQEIIFYKSNNLKEWQETGRFDNGKKNANIVWETPELFQLSLQNNSETYWVLIIGCLEKEKGSKTLYCIGQFDGKTFTSQTDMLDMDAGADFYAPQSWNDEPNQRRILVAWMNNWDYARKTPTQGWRGMFSIPREVNLIQTSQGIRLRQQPIKELESLRGELIFQIKETKILANQNILHNIQAVCYVIIATIQLEENTQPFGFYVRKNKEEKTIVGYEPTTQKVYINRTQSGMTEFNKTFASVHSAHIVSNPKNLQIHIFVDNCSVELFANHGEVTITDLIFPSHKNTALDFFNKGEVMINQLEIYTMKPIQYKDTSAT